MKRAFLVIISIISVIFGIGRIMDLIGTIVDGQAYLLASVPGVITAIAAFAPFVMGLFGILFYTNKTSLKAAHIVMWAGFAVYFGVRLIPLLITGFQYGDNVFTRIASALLSAESINVSVPAGCVLFLAIFMELIAWEDRKKRRAMRMQATERETAEIFVTDTEDANPEQTDLPDTETENVDEEVPVQDERTDEDQTKEPIQL